MQATAESITQREELRALLARTLTWAAPALLAAVTLMPRLALGPQTIDDAYITFRYSRNIAEGLGFVYNAGEHVLGTTTPLWTLTLAACYWLGLHDLPRVALVLSALFDAGSCLTLWWLVRRFGLSTLWAGTIGVTFALAPRLVATSASGMETSLFIALVLLAGAADVSGRSGLAGVLAGLATLTRPDGLLVVALIVGRHLLRRRLPVRLLLGLVLPLLPWIAFALVWFGSPIPHTMIAKAVAYDVDRIANVSAFARYAAESLPFPLPLTAIVAVPRIPALVRFARSRPETWLMIGFGPLLFLGYVAAGAAGVRLFSWYAAPVAPFYVLGLIAALGLAAQRLNAATRILVVGILLVIVLGGLTPGAAPGGPVLSVRGDGLGRERAFIQAAGLLRPCVDEGTTVALPEIGAFGYVSGARVLDTVGLVSPVATRHYPVGFRANVDNVVPPTLIRDQRPDYLVGVDVLLPPELTEADWFQRDYRRIATIPEDLAWFWDARAVVVYARADVPDASCGLPSPGS